MLNLKCKQRNVTFVSLKVIVILNGMLYRMRVTCLLVDVNKTTTNVGVREERRKQ